MSLTNIQLPPQVMADLYKNLLIEDDKPMQTAAPKTATVVAAPAIENTEKITTPAPTPVEEKIVPAPPVPVTTAADPATAYRFLGNHAKQVSIIVNCPGETYLPENHLQFLTKILGACRLNLGDVAIINNAALAVDINQLKQQINPKFALLMGIEPTSIGLPLSFPQFKEQEYAGTRYLFTVSLDELNQETASGKQLKGQLWACLKKMFDL
ncbi:MAG: hypothetical protein QM731_00770 [Chitinophagaceae bacterium]